MALLSRSASCCIAGLETDAAFNRYAHRGFWSGFRILGTCGLGRFTITKRRSSHMIMNDTWYASSPKLRAEHTRLQ